MTRHIVTFRNKALLLIAITCSLGWATHGLAADPVEGTSLAFVPADTSFYYSMQNNRAVYDRVVASKAYAKLQQLPLFQLGVMMAQAQAQDPEGEFSEIMKEWNKPENQELTALVGEMASREMFIYGDGNWAELYALQNDAYRSIWNEMMSDFSQSVLDGDFDPDTQPTPEFSDELARKIIDGLDRLEFPTLVIGFAIEDEDQAKRQLDRLEELVNGFQPPKEVKMKLPRREQIGNGDYLTAAVEGFVIDFDDVDSENGLPPELDRKLRDMVENLTFHVSVGVDRGFVLVSVGPNNDHLAKLGEGDLLIDRAELKAVREAGNRTITSVSFTDSRWIEETYFGPESVQSWADFAKAIIGSEDAEIDSEVQDMWLVGIDEVSSGIKKWFPERGSRMDFSWLSEHGFEGYRYNWDENIAYNGEDHLSVLEHVGGDPIFFWLTRHKYRPESWDPLFKLGDLFIDTVEQVAADDLDDEEFKQFQRWLVEGRPLLDRAVAIYREQYSAGLADGQVAWVLDAKQAKRNWVEGLPSADEPLAIPEFATVNGVSDPEKIKNAARQGLALMFEIRDKIEQVLGENDLPIDLDEITEPKHITNDVGEFLQFPATTEATVLKDFVSTTGLSDDTLVSASSFPQAERLLKPTPLKIEGPIMTHQGPAFDATYFNWAKLLDTATPWVDYWHKLAVVKAEAEADDAANEADDDEDFPADEFDPFDGLVPEFDDATVMQIHSAIEFLQCFQQYSSISYMEGEAQVTHYEWRFQDLP